MFLTRAGWKCVNFTFCSRILIATKYKVVYSVPVSSFIEREILQQTGKLDSFQYFLHEFKYFCGNINILPQVRRDSSAECCLNICRTVHEALNWLLR